jgi:hypothetical protein
VTKKKRIFRKEENPHGRHPGENVGEHRPLLVHRFINTAAYFCSRPSSSMGAEDEKLALPAPARDAGASEPCVPELELGNERKGLGAMGPVWRNGVAWMKVRRFLTDWLERMVQ